MTYGKEVVHYPDANQDFFVNSSTNFVNVNLKLWALFII